MDDRNYRDVFWCNISEKSVNRKTIKAKDLKLGDKFFYNGYEYTVKYISEARVLAVVELWAVRLIFTKRLMLKLESSYLSVS